MIINQQKKMKATLSILVLIIGNHFLYSQPIDQFVDEEIKVNMDNIPNNKSQNYFPFEFFQEKSNGSTTPVRYKIDGISHDTFVVNWYSKCLFVLNEPLLFNKVLTKEVYRFTWLRTFHHPVSIRIEKENDKYELTWKVSDGSGGYDPGKLILNKSKKIKKKHWTGFINLLKTCNFWNIDLVRTTPDCDGAEWILEGNDSVNYNVVAKQSPSEGAFFDVCNYLIKLTNLTL